MAVVRLATTIPLTRVHLPALCVLTMKYSSADQRVGGRNVKRYAIVGFLDGLLVTGPFRLLHLKPQEKASWGIYIIHIYIYIRLRISIHVIQSRVGKDLDVLDGFLKVGNRILGFIEP